MTGGLDNDGDTQAGEREGGGGGDRDESGLATSAIDISHSLTDTENLEQSSDLETAGTRVVAAEAVEIAGSEPTDELTQPTATRGGWVSALRPSLDTDDDEDDDNDDGDGDDWHDGG